MEDWQLDFEWLRVRHYVKETLKADQLPDLNLVLLLIGIQELGQVRKQYTKDEKRDLMHVGACTLLSLDGYFEFVGRDDEGWPHFKQAMRLTVAGEKPQEQLLKLLAVRYFDLPLEQES